MVVTVAEKTATAAGLNADSVAAISVQKQDPSWFVDLRRRAWRFFEEIPWPTGNEEEWRRTRLTGLDIGSFRLAQGTTGLGDRSDLPEYLRQELDTIDSAGALVTENGTARYHTLSDELAAKGVIFTDLDTAIRQQPELINPDRDWHIQRQGYALRYTAAHQVPYFPNNNGNQ